MPVTNCPHCQKNLSLPSDSGDYDCPQCDQEFFWNGSVTQKYEKNRPLYQYPMIILNSLDLPIADFSGIDDSDTWWASISKIAFLLSISFFILLPFTIVGAVLGFLFSIVSSTIGGIVGFIFSFIGFIAWFYYIIILSISALSIHFRRANGADMSGLFSLIIMIIPLINFIGIPLVVYKFGWD